jgi:hypothetical protein
LLMLLNYYFFPVGTGRLSIELRNIWNTIRRCGMTSWE